MLHNIFSFFCTIMWKICQFITLLASFIKSALINATRVKSDSRPSSVTA